MPTDENRGEVSLAKEEREDVDEGIAIACVSKERSFCTADLFKEYRFRSLFQSLIYSFRIRKRIHIMVGVISVQIRKESSLTTRIGIKEKIRKTGTKIERSKIVLVEVD